MNSRQNPPTDIASLVAPGVRQLKPYLPGKPISELERDHGVSESIKLASNENPLGASPAAVAAIRDGIDGLALYPDGGGFSLKSALSKKHGIPAQAITLGNGSNDVLVLLAEAFLTPGTNAVYSQYCYINQPGCRLKRNPTKSREVDFRPGMGVHSGNKVSSIIRIVTSFGISDRQAGREPNRAGQHDHGCCVIIAVTTLQIEQEILHNIAIGRRKWDG